MKKNTNLLATKHEKKHELLSKRNHGFTMIEVFLVVAIMAVIAVIGGINIFAYYQKQALESNFTQIVNSLKSTRVKSIQQDESSQWGIRFDNSSSTPYYAEFKGSVYATSSITKKTYLPPSLQFISPTSTAVLDISFSKITGTASSSAVIVIAPKRDLSDTKTINISPSEGIQY